MTLVRRGELDLDVSAWSVDPVPAPRLVVAQALAKGGRDEAAVEVMTEAGVDEVLGWQASRCVAKWTERTGSKWTATAEAAARQARRTWWPVITGPVTTTQLAARLAAVGQALILHEGAADSIAAVDMHPSAEVLVVVGPEGGIADDELAAFVAAGARPVRMGDTVLRSSTAGVVALAVVAARTRWLGCQP